MFLLLFWAIGRFDWINFAYLHVDFRQKARGRSRGSRRTCQIEHFVNIMECDSSVFFTTHKTVLVLESETSRVVCNRTNRLFEWCQTSRVLKLKTRVWGNQEADALIFGFLQENWKLSLPSMFSLWKWSTWTEPPGCHVNILALSSCSEQETPQSFLPT